MSRGFLNTVVFLILSVSVSFGYEIPDRVHDSILEYFAEKFDVSKKDILIEYTRSTTQLQSNIDYKIESRSLTPKLGSQILWLNQIKNQHIVSKNPLSVRVSIYMRVATITSNIQRGETISEDQIMFSKVKVERNGNDYIRNLDQINEQVLRNNLREGELLRHSLLMEKPDVRRGESLNIKFVKGSIVIEADGTAREDGQIGESLRAICDLSRKQVTGLLTNQNTLVINLE